MTTALELRHEIGVNLRRFARVSAPPGALRAAAVAIAVVHDGKQASFLLTRRPAHSRRHSNQFALPGGCAEAGESAAAAARRELFEELGVTLAEDAWLGELDDYVTRSGFVITPVVFWCGPPPAITADPDEVAHVYHVATTRLSDEHLVDEAPGPEPGRPILSLNLLDTRIFAPTAALILQFRDVALHGLPTRVGHYDQPTFAWQ